MPIPIETITTAALSRALDLATLRHQVIAANVANHATEGYVPLQASFAAAFDQARAGQSDGGASLDLPALAAMRPEVGARLDAQGRPVPVRLDAEMADMAQNAVQYQALARGLARHLSILAIAAGDGRK